MPYGARNEEKWRLGRLGTATCTTETQDIVPVYESMQAHINDHNSSRYNPPNRTF
jgi:hypothetical protein